MQDNVLVNEIFTVNAFLELKKDWTSPKYLYSK